MNIDPKWRFIIGLAVTFAIGVSSGAVGLTNAIPGDWIKPATAWCGIIAFIGSAAQTTISGFGMSNSSRAAAAASLPASDMITLASSLPARDKVALAAAAPEVRQIVTTRAIAQAAGPVGDGAKVVSAS